jgi:S1-C subfamily serine protease
MNRFINISIAIIILSYLIVAVTWMETVHAQSVHDTIRPSLVYLKATALGKEGPQTGVPVESHATGFLVSEDGLVLTVYHLISELGNVVPQSVRIEARIGDKHSAPLSAMLVEGKQITDLLLLNIAPGKDKYPKVTLGNARSHPKGGTVYTSGFTKSITYRYHEDKIEAREGPRGYLWTTGLEFENGQSGSPIYNAAGEIIGVVKGENKKGTLSYMIPIGFADSLIAQVRFAEIKNALQDFESLRHTINWAGKLTGSNRRPVVTIKYEKMVAGEPHVEAIDLKIRLRVKIDGEEEYIHPPLKFLNLARKGKTSKTGGAFELKGGIWQDKFDHLKENWSIEEIMYLKAIIIPRLTEGTVLPSKTITISYEED